MIQILLVLFALPRPDASGGGEGIEAAQSVPWCSLKGDYGDICHMVIESNEANNYIEGEIV